MTDREQDPRSPSDLLENALTGARGEDEELRALRQAFEDGVRLPADAHVAGVPVTVLELGYDGNVRRGLVARCRGPDGGEHVLAACDLAFPGGSDGALHVEAYREWLGVGTAPPQPAPPRPKRHLVEDGDVDLSAPVELVVLAPKRRAARCVLLGTQREITVRSRDVWKMVPGEIATVRGKKLWTYGGRPYLSGEMEGSRLDAGALGLTPLRLRDESTWDPRDEWWGEDDEPLEDWARAVLARGPCRSFEMEQVLPGVGPDDWEEVDPILDASERAAMGDPEGAREILLDLLVADLRCLDAHAHLGNFAFDRRPEDALRHHEAGVRIGELSLGEGFTGVLPWGRLDNRPFLRCLHGFGLSLWRLGRHDEAAEALERLLRLSPTDAQGVRFVLPSVRAGEAWSPEPA